MITPMPGRMAGIDEEHEVLRAAETRRGREIAGDLIAPGARERMLLDGQQFDVGVAHALHVFDQLDGQFPVGQQTRPRGLRIHDSRCTS